MKPLLMTDIEKKAAEVLHQTGALMLPVPIDRVAHRLGLQVEEAVLGDDIAGVLVIENGQGTIGYNAAHHLVRQRFSVAHEIGHYVLHQDSGQLFIDKNYPVTYYRDGDSSKGENLQELQANRFAAALLMPKELVIQELQSMNFDLGGDAEQGLALLARRFQVSTQALSYRLSHLRVFLDEPA